MKSKKLLTLTLAILMCVLVTLSLCACGEKSTEQPQTQTQSETVDPLWSSATYSENTTLGTGDKAIVVTVKAGEKSIDVTINTDAETLEQALISVDLIQGDESSYGLYIKTVNGINADYEKDGYYWAIFADGEYLTQGANKTNIKSGDKFELVRSK